MEPARAVWISRAAVVAGAVLVPALAYFLFGRQHLNLADEGYLWYGVQRTLAGEVPLRDFQAYDPGRYHWCALLAPLVGDGIVGVRAAVALLSALGLGFGLLVMKRAVRHPALLLAAGAMLGLWLFPRHKLFEHVMALVLAWSTVRMLERPTVARHLVGGLVVGLAAYVGRNHALYGALAGGAVLVLDAWKDPRPGWLERAGAWAGGIAAGFAPLLAMMLIVPGFASSYVDSVRVILEEGANLPKPWPWPWDTSWSAAALTADPRAAVESIAFLLPILGAAAVAWTIARTPRSLWRARAALVGAGAVGIVYLHHVSVRSDMPHLAQSLPPLLVALLLLPRVASAGRAWTMGLWSTLALLSAAVGATLNPPVATHLAGRELTVHEVAGERLQLAPGQAALLGALERTLATHVGPAPLFIAPNRPSYYCILGKRAPTWWIYYFWEAPPDEQDATIESLRQQGVDWALIVDSPVDDRADLLFRSTNPRVWAHFRNEWEHVPTPGLPADHLLLHRR